MASGTEQEAFWKGEFGDEYSNRNVGVEWVAANTAFFSEILGRTRNVKTVLELGANIGLNLHAIRQLLPAATLTAVEINETAAKELKAKLPEVNLHIGSMLEFKPYSKWDLVFTKGVLIHINPEKLPLVYDLLHASSARYVLLAEYYNPSPVEVTYRGHAGKLFKRDFAGEMLDRFPDLQLIDYGFAYRRDPNFPQDDLTWFLIEKR